MEEDRSAPMSASARLAAGRPSTASPMGAPVVARRSSIQAKRKQVVTCDRVRSFAGSPPYGSRRCRGRQNGRGQNDSRPASRRLEKTMFSYSRACLTRVRRTGRIAFSPRPNARHGREFATPPLMAPAPFRTRTQNGPTPATCPWRIDKIMPRRESGTNLDSADAGLAGVLLARHAFGGHYRNAGNRSASFPGRPRSRTGFGLGTRVELFRSAAR